MLLEMYARVKPVFCAVVRSGIGDYVEFLNDVSTGNYERAVTCNITKIFFNLIETTGIETLSSLEAVIVAAVKGFMSTTADEEETVLKSELVLLLFLFTSLFYISLLLSLIHI